MLKKLVLFWLFPCISLWGFSQATGILAETDNEEKVFSFMLDGEGPFNIHILDDYPENSKHLLSATGYFAVFYDKKGLGTGRSDILKDFVRREFFSENNQINHLDNSSDFNSNVFFKVSQSLQAMAEIKIFAKAEPSQPIWEMKIPRSIPYSFYAPMTIEKHMTITKEKASEKELIELVIISEGYTAADEQKFYDDSIRVMKDFFNEAPLSSLKKYFNVSLVFVASRDRGAKDNPRDEKVDTALGAYFNCDNISRLLCIDHGKLRTVLNGINHRKDLVGVLVNSTRYGGSGGVVAVQSLTGEDIFDHEIAHTFATLSLEDEYSYGGTYDCGWVANAPNVTSNPDKSSAPWKHLFNQSGVGFYEGAAYCQKGAWRGTQNSKMRSLGVPWGPVNSDAWITAVEKYIKMLNEECTNDVCPFSWGL